MLRLVVPRREQNLCMLTVLRKGVRIGVRTARLLISGKTPLSVHSVVPMFPEGGCLCCRFGGVAAAPSVNQVHDACPFASITYINTEPGYQPRAIEDQVAKTSLLL